jgi:hypothetical protein
MALIRAIAAYLGIACRIALSSDLAPNGVRDDRHISLARILGADTYVSGRGGAAYQDPQRFREAGVSLQIADYRPVPYRQIHGDFLPGLSIIDALFALGRGASALLAYESAAEPVKV